MKSPLVRLLAALVVIGVPFLVYAQTSRQLFSADIVQNMQRPCSFSGKTAVTLTISAVSAATVSAFDRGVVAMVCGTAVHYRMSTSAPTAVAADMLLPANTMLQFASESDFVAAIQDAAGGTCYLVQCR